MVKHKNSTRRRGGAWYNPFSWGKSDETAIGTSGMTAPSMDTSIGGPYGSPSTSMGGKKRKLKTRRNRRNRRLSRKY